MISPQFTYSLFGDHFILWNLVLLIILHFYLRVILVERVHCSHFFGRDEKCLFGRISLYSEESVQAGQHEFIKFVVELNLLSGKADSLGLQMLTLMLANESDRCVLCGYDQTAKITQENGIHEMVLIEPCSVTERRKTSVFLT